MEEATLFVITRQQKLITHFGDKFPVVVLPSFFKALRLMKTRSLNYSLFIVDQRLLVSKSALNFPSFYKKSQKQSNRLILFSESKVPPLYKKVRFDDYLDNSISKSSLQDKITLHLESLRQLKRLKSIESIDQALQIIFANVPIGVCISSGSGLKIDEDQIDYVNSAYSEIVGRSAEELKDNNWLTFTHPDSLGVELEKHKMLQEGKITNYSVVKKYIKPDGSITWVNLISSLLDLKPYKYVAFVQDITAQKEIELSLLESERSKSVFFENLPGMVYRCKYDKDWTMEFLSNGCTELTGYHPIEFINNSRISFNEIIAPEYSDLVSDKWEEAVKNKSIFNFEYEIITSENKRKWVLERGQAVYDKEGEVEVLEGVILDITEQKEAEKELILYSQYDRLTGLPNLHSLEKTLKEAFNQKRKMAIVGLNVTTLHQVSVRYGFSYGQHLINRLGEALKSVSNKNIKLFSIYENYLALLIKNYKDKEQLLNLAKQASKIVEETFALEYIGWGVGILELTKSSLDNFELLLKNLVASADKSLSTYSSKFEISFFDENLQEALIRENEITKALIAFTEGKEAKSIYLNYQPIVRLVDNEVWAFEALARLETENLGLVMPLEFIPIAEKSKLILPLGKKIIELGCQFIKKVHQSGFSNILLAINISPTQLLDYDFIPFLVKTVGLMNLESSSIILEITENEVALNNVEINTVLGDLKAVGFHVALDDFGTGYSSLSKELELNIDCVKIDKLFIDLLTEGAGQESIVENIIGIAHKLEHCVIAEGVEHVSQKEHLMRFGCDMIQGYLFSKPLSEQKAFELISIID